MTEERCDGGTVVEARDGAQSVATAVGSGTAEGRLRRQARQLSALATSEITLGLRRRWVLLLAGLFTVFGQLLLTFAGSTPGPAGFERTLASLAMLSVYLVPLAALAYGYSVVVGPADSGWLESIAALPVSRGTIVIGSVAGRAVVLVGGVAFGFAIPGFVLVNEFGLAYWSPYAAVLLAVIALALAFLGIAALCSALFRTKTHALGAALLAWLWFVLIHDLLGLGVVAAFDLSAGAVGAIVLANPASTYRVLVLSILGADGSGFAAAGSVAGLSTGVLVLGLLAWTIVPTLAAALALRIRGPG